MNPKTEVIGMGAGEGKTVKSVIQNDNGNPIKVHVSDLVVYGKPVAHLLGCRMSIKELIDFLEVRE